MQKTLVSWASRSWRPHSELIQGWIAGASSESRYLQQARSYLYELKLEEALEEVEDATDLVYFMHRLSYPAGSHLETRVGEFFKESAEQMSREHLLVICRQLKEHPGSGSLWLRVMFEQKWFVNGVADMLAKLTLEEHLTFCAALWRSVHSTPQSRSNWNVACGTTITLSYKLAMLTVQRIERFDNDGRGVCLCAELDIPLHEESLKALRELLFSRTRDVLSAVQVLGVAEALAGHCHITFSHAKWFEALQEAICCRPQGSFEAAQIVGVLRATLKLRLAQSNTAFEEALVQVLPSMSREDVLHCCESLSAVPNLFSRLRVELLDLLRSETEGSRANSSGDDVTFLWQLRCMSLIAPVEATGLLTCLVQRLKETEKVLPESVTMCLVRSMKEMQTFPPEVVSRCKTSFLQSAPFSFTQEDAAYLLYVAAHAGEPADGAFFGEVLNRFASSRKFDRRKQAVHHNAILSIGTVAMVLQALSVAKGGQLSSGSRVYSLIRDAVEQHQRQNRISVEDGIGILKLLVQVKVDDTPLKMALLTSVSKSIADMTSERVVELCEVLVALKSRDILMLRALFSHLAQIHPDHKSITSAASAARRLQFVPYFQQSGLMEHVTSLEGWSVSNVVLVASACSVKQRKALLTLPGAATILHTRLEDLTTVDLFLLLSIADEDWKRTSEMSAALNARPPLGKGDVEVEDACRAIVNVVRDKEALAAVCRSAASVLQNVDENVLMRILDAVSAAPDLPNVFFRVVGKSVVRLASSMTVDNALRWLQLYVKYQIRDDSVGRALLAKARTRSNCCATTMDKMIQKAATMYGRSYTLQAKPKKYEEKMEWHPYGST